MRFSNLRAFLLSLALLLSAAHASAAPAPQSDALSLGSPKARVVVEEYASLSCVHCAHFNNEVFPAFKKKYIDTGKVRYILHEFLTPPENVSGVGFIVARCAGPTKYFAVVDDFFHRQATIYETQDLRTSLLALGVKFGMNEAAINACLENPAYTDALNARVKVAVDKGINSTPTFVINGVKAPEGTMRLDQLDKLIAAAGKARR